MLLIKIGVIREILFFLLVIDCTFNYPHGTEVTSFNLGTIDMISDVGRTLRDKAVQKRRAKRSGKKHNNMYKYFVETGF